MRGRKGVARRFRGEFRQKVDTKGRVSIPAQFRRVLERGDPGWSDGKLPDFVIFYGDIRKSYIQCFTIEAFEQVEAGIERLPRSSPKRKALEDLYNGHSTQVTVDDTGRIVLSKKLRERVGLGAEAYFIASGDTFQLWDNATYEKEKGGNPLAWLEEMPEDFDPLSYVDEAQGD